MTMERGEWYRIDLLCYMEFIENSFSNVAENKLKAWPCPLGFMRQLLPILYSHDYCLTRFSLVGDSFIEHYLRTRSLEFFF
jgi:hypothetical protein